MRRAALSAGIFAATLAILPVAARQSSQKPASSDLPPLSYVCKMVGSPGTELEFAL